MSIDRIFPGQTLIGAALTELCLVRCYLRVVESWSDWTSYGCCSSPVERMDCCHQGLHRGLNFPVMRIMDCMSSLTRLHYVSKMPALQACIASDVLCHVPKERYAACVYPLARIVSSLNMASGVWSLESAGDDMLVPSFPREV